jgi:hypothetical protein
VVAAARAIFAVLATRQLEAIRRAHAKETDGREAGSLRRPLRRRDYHGRVASTEANVPTIARADANGADVGMIPLAAQRGSTPRADAVSGLSCLLPRLNARLETGRMR